MAKITYAHIHQEVELRNKGVEFDFYNDGSKGGTLYVKKATIEWFEANAKIPTWSGTWEELATALSTWRAQCKHCDQWNNVRKQAAMNTCTNCNKRFKVTW